MPNTASPTQVAAHFIQANLNTSAPDPKTNLRRKVDVDFFFLKQFYEKVKELAEREGASQNIKDLKENLQGFREATEKTALLYDRSTPKERKKDLHQAAVFANNIDLIAKDIQGKEAEELMGDPDDPDDYLGKWNQLETDRGGAVLKACGEVKSAAKWIEMFRKEVPKGGEITAEDVALVFACRQLAQAERGKRKNIDKTMLSEAEIVAQAEKLSQSPEFKKYMQTHAPINEKTFRDGHGGKLEESFEQFLIDEKAKGAHEFDYKGRYQKKVDKAVGIGENWVDVSKDDAAQLNEDLKEERRNIKVEERATYRTYQDYFKRNVLGAHPEDQQEKDPARRPDSHTAPLAYAARMAAANDLSRKDPTAPFDRKELDKRARTFLKDPAFRLLSKDHEAMDALRQGKPDVYAQHVEDMTLSCSAMLTDSGKLEPKGEIGPSLDRLEQNVQDRLEEDPQDKKALELKGICEGVRKLQGEGNKPKDVINTLNAITTYQDKYAGDAMEPDGKNLNDTVRLLYEMTKGRSIGSLVQPQIDNINAQRGFEPGAKQHITKEFIAQEGIDAKKAQQGEVQKDGQQAENGGGIQIG